MCPRQSQIPNPKSQIAPLAILTFFTVLLTAPLPAQDDPFAAGVRTTPWLTPADEQKHFKLPPGFEINLVAAEPDIQKPLNMAFDERGRIWLTSSVEYPYAAPPDRPGKDTIKVLEDTDGDGRYEKITTFADGLNIPMGIYPWKGGCVAFSIPNIWHLEDTDADGVCDKRTVLYGPFDTSRDTHGMVNSFRRGWDGWVYACHGFNNDSRVKGRDGHEIHMQSGNVFRFQLDGSRLEHFTHGQVNPFGMCFDELFNIFTADCHSKPIYQLLRGGYYPSFGKPHDGLGFVPPMMDHAHGSTAICGLVKYSGENFPAEYRGDFYSGNVMTSRINRNKPEYHGSTIKAIEQPDFLATTDPWFRPVDIHIGPDGAMYILDFYNRIIGHYEVPLPHPGRDRTSGRIWRVTYTGNGVAANSAVGNALRGVPRTLTDLTKLSVAQLIEQFDLTQLEFRLRVLHHLLDAKGSECLPEAQAALRSPRSATQRIGALWILQRLQNLSSEQVGLEATSSDRATQVHALKAFGESFGSNRYERMLAVQLLDDPDAFVQRAAAESLARHPQFDAFRGLVKRLPKIPAEDSLMRHALRLSLREHLSSFNAGEGGVISDGNVFDENEHQMILPIAISASSSGASQVLLTYLSRATPNLNPLLDYERLATNILESETQRLVDLCRRRDGDSAEVQGSVIKSLYAGFSRKSASAAQLLTPWGDEIARKLLGSEDNDRVPWTAVPIDNLPPSENPWVIAARPSRDGDKESVFYYSLPKGEQRTGIYRSGTFAIPEKLSFWCAGHSGVPNQPPKVTNHVRLRDAKTHALLAESRPPRNDTARQFTWILTDHVGKLGYIELIDGDTGNAYAWLAVGRFSLDVLNPGQEATRQQLAADIIGKLKLDSFRPHLATLLSSPDTEITARTAIAQALVSLDPDARAAALAAALADPSLPAELRPRIGYAITVKSDSEYLDNLRTVMQRVPTRLQTTLADTLSGDAPGAALLLTLIESGHATPRLLLAPALKNKLGALNDAKLNERATSITSKLPPADAILDTLIIERRREFARATKNHERGQAVYAKHCAACHKIADKGALVGPQLDGIGNRGLDRLLEDILDPNRNVDIAFRTTTLRLTDGRVLSGLIRREEGNQIILADNQGKELSVAKSDIDEQQKTPLSLMPANVGEITTPDEFADLMSYLLSQRAAPSSR